MGITVTNTIAGLEHAELLTGEDMRALALLLREGIIRRTVGGTDARGQAFRPYSPAYAKAKGQALGDARVNLQVSGAMLNDITIIEVAGWPRPRAVLGFSK
jgi:hypothetical protein